MSGGHWGYRREQLHEQADEIAALIRVVGEVEHALDWEICGDWRRGEGETVAAQLMRDFFDHKPPRTANQVAAALRED